MPDLAVFTASKEDRVYFKNISWKVSRAFLTDAMIVASTHRILVTSRVNGVPRTGS
jgi:hypothetical protein